MDTSRTLTLSVNAAHAEQFGSDARKCFDSEGGRIGRAEDCEWTLRAPGVSRLHAVVRYVDDTYFLEDRSSNGMLLNGEPLRKGHPTPLKDGDRLHVDTFEIGVDIASDDTATAARHDAMATAPAMPAPALPTTPIPDDAEPLIPGTSSLGMIDPALDPLAFLDAAPAMATPEPSFEDSWNHTPGSADLFHPPRTTGSGTSAPTLPENWELTGVPPAEPEPPIAIESPTPEPVAAQPTPDAPQADLHGLFHAAIDGIIDVLRARNELKNTFRLPVTVIQRSENNPLKFAPNAQEAVSKLLSPANPAFLTGEAALDDAVEDIRHHQVAMLFGMRTAFHAMLERFDPAGFEPSAPVGRAPFRRKEQPWDIYRRQFQALTANPDCCFQRLFGDVFAQAYEEQLARLKTHRQPIFAQGGTSS